MTSPKAQARRKSHKETETQREAGPGTVLIPENSPLPSHLMINLPLLSLSGTLSTATNITKMETMWLLWELSNYKVSVTIAGTKQINVKKFLFILCICLWNHI